MDNVRISDINTDQEKCDLFNRLIDNQKHIEAKLLQTISKNDAYNKEVERYNEGLLKKGMVHMKTLLTMVIVALMVFANSAIGTVDITEVNFTNVQAGNFDQSLRRWIDTLNTDITNAGGVTSNLGTGTIFYVDSGPGNSSSATGLTLATAAPTIDDGINLCTANAGDVIFVMQGHTESFTATDDADIDVAGIMIIGLGTGELRPTLSYTASGEFVLGANGDNSVVANLRFIATSDSVVKAIDVEAACVGWSIVGCEFSAETTTVDEFDDVIIVGAAADKGLILSCRFLGDPGANAEPQSCINFVDSDYLRIIGNTAFGDRAVACIQNESTASNFITILNNHLFNGIIGGTAGLNTEPCIELVATTTGIIDGNRLFCNVATPEAAIVAADGMLGENFYSEIESSSPLPMGWTTDSLQNKLGVDDAANLGTTANVTEDGDGSLLERAEFLQNKSDEILAQLGATGESIGNVFYVDSVTGSSGDDGTTWALAEDTIANGYGDTTANKGDIVFVATLHAESLGAAQLTLSTAGVKIIGLGDGDQRPIVTFDDSSSSIDVTAADNLLKNIKLLCTTQDTDIGVDIAGTGDGFIMEDCEMSNSSAFNFTEHINIQTAGDRVTIKSSLFTSTTSGATSVIIVDTGVVTQLSVIGNRMFGNFSTATISSDQVNINNIIRDNVINNTNAASLCISATAAMTGEVVDNMLSGGTYGLILDPGSMRTYGNKQTVGIDAGAEDVPLIKGKSYARAMLTGDTNATDNLFDVTGGQIIVTSFVAKATVAVGGATVMKVNVNADDTFDYDLSTSVDIDTVDAGGLLTFTATAGESVLAVQAVGSSGSMGVPIQWWIEEGMIESTVDSGGSTGDLEWYMIFTPVADGVEVVPQ